MAATAGLPAPVGNTCAGLTPGALPLWRLDEVL
ncbi:hypothetical protein Cabther_A1573 [Chloracidobacterium thermophilum B]|uniref:Uncharacterized protein n=1 Tax=Chloracidobacterium thermophilum (strain B) TaxID=981222 RepID=G2LIV5_CHLTF|nr:hypothetical protein Cabther_A1573 [Chloracidobacterium thermophilum B]